MEKNLYLILSCWALLAVIAALNSFYRPAISLVLFITIRQIKKIEYVQNFLSGFSKDQESISYHWKNDNDLIFLTKITRVCLITGIGVFLLGFYLLLTKSPYNITLNDLTQYNLKNFSYIVYIGLGLFLIGMFLNFLAELHIIYYRNSWVSWKTASTVWNTARWVVPTTLIPIGAVDVVSSTPAVAPSNLGNWYQIISPNGRGYGYASHRQMIQDGSLQLYRGYNKDEFINPITKIMDQNKLNTFIKANAEDIKKQLPIADCQNLGLNKLW
jgi:hypothetical protein